MDKPFALLIEDDRDIAALFRHVLNMAGYRTENIFDGSEAMQRLSAVKPDVVLLDLQLPGVSGIDILTYIRSDERLKTTPIVVITAYGHYVDSLPVEPDLFLIKPVDIQDLINLTQRLRFTKSKTEESPYDKVTHLNTISFFSIRLVFALESVKRSDLERFGVLFASLHPYDKLQKKLSESIFNSLLRKMADQFKSTLRPTDSMAWSKDGYFLTLFEDTFEDIPELIAERVGNGLNEFMKYHKLDRAFQAHIGVVMCDDSYKTVQEILDDVSFMQMRIRKQLKKGNQIFTRDSIRELRS